QLRHWGRGSDRATDLSVAAELNELLEDGTTEQILAAASKHPEYAPIIYLQLMERARQAGDFEQVRKIADTYITDPEKRKNILAQFGNVEKKAARNQVALAEIEEELAKIPQPFVQAWFLLGEAHKFGDNDRKIALNLLDRASDLIHSIKPGKEQTTAQLGLAVMYCYEKNERCFGIMESLMPRLNELVDVAARLDGYETNYLRDGEWNMSANGAVGELLTRLSETAGAFAWFDFDRAVSLASRFDRAEIRMMAHVKLAQSILAGPLKRLPPFTER
ncbi:MAG TPA: hypothetical protein VHH35_13340, partial [Pyrinomonadaceae bacterium]|nr:hypothetical protein [Pyrinomonadaceae bacterium]